MQIVEKTHPTVQAETQSSCINVAMVGGGSDCKSLIQFLEEQSLKRFHGHMIGVADLREGALGSSSHRPQQFDHLRGSWYSLTIEVQQCLQPGPGKVVCESSSASSARRTVFS